MSHRIRKCGFNAAIIDIYPSARDGLLFEPRCFRHTLSTPVNALHKVASWRRATMARSDRKP